MATLPKIIILSGPDEGKQFALSGQGPFFIGRSDDSEVALSDTSVSRKHSRISFKDGEWLVRDESSRNGTFLNEVRLDAGTTTKIKNQDVLRVGIYELKFDEGDVTDFEIKAEPQLKTEETLEANSSHHPEESTEKEKLLRMGSYNAVVLKQPGYETDQDELHKIREEEGNQVSLFSSPKMGKSFVVFLVIAVIFCVIAFGLFFALQEHNRTQPTEPVEQPVDQTAPATEQTVPVEQPDTTKAPDDVPPDATAPDEAAPVNPPEAPQTAPVTVPEQPVEQTQQAPANSFSVFLDVKTTPLPATIFFEDRRLGLAPIKESVSVENDKTYSVYADFELRELNDVYRKTVELKPKPDMDVVELAIDGEIGMLKILSLPKNTEFYLEGYYAYDQLKANPVKVTDIIYGKPIYLPYGRYVVELREQAKVAGSDNLITQVRYQREYVIDKDNRSIELQVAERDLQFFPAVIKSNPSNATVYFGDVQMGTTPFSGPLPQGAHQLKIVKEGFFPYIKDVDLRMNSVYELTAELKTSKMGELINSAKNKLRNDQTDAAINTLVEALKYGGSAREKAEVYYLLGNTYLVQKRYDEALPYFEKAKSEPAFFIKGALGLAKTHNAMKHATEALKFVVEALVNLDSKTPRDLRAEANDVFKLISPVKSVMYITSEPPKATVYMNDKRIEQQTPLIMSDLGLGNYRLQFEKAGFQTYKTSQNLKIGEFVLVKIKLEPEKL